MVALFCTLAPCSQDAVHWLPCLDILCGAPELNCPAMSDSTLVLSCPWTCSVLPCLTLPLSCPAKQPLRPPYFRCSSPTLHRRGCFKPALINCCFPAFAWVSQSWPLYCVPHALLEPDCSSPEACLCLSAALATEDPSPDLLLETPHGRTEPLINPAMWTHIMVQGVYQVIVRSLLCLRPLFPMLLCQC